MMENIWLSIEQCHERLTTTTGGKEDCPVEKRVIENFLAETPYDEIFGYLTALDAQNSRDEAKKVKIICYVLNRIFSSSVGSDLFSTPELYYYLIQGLTHDQVMLRQLTIEHVVKQASVLPLDNMVLIQAVAQRIADEDLSVSRHACDFFTRRMSSTEGSSDDDIYPVLYQESQRWTKDTTVQLRFIHLFATISSSSNDRCRVCIENHWFETLSVYMRNYAQDALVTMNVLDAILIVGQTRVGIALTFDQGWIDVLLDMKTHPMLSSTSMRILAQLVQRCSSQQDQDMSSSCSQAFSRPTTQEAFLEWIQESLTTSSNNSQMMILSAIDAMSLYARASISTLDTLVGEENPQPCLFRALTQDWLQFTTHANMELRVACLHALARVLANRTRLRTENVPESREKIWRLNEALFHHPSCAKMDVLMRYLRQPFEDNRMSVFMILRAVAAQNAPWGLQTLFRCAGFFEFLLNRSTERTKELKEWKFSILDAVVSSPYFKSYPFGQDSHQSRLLASFARGPYLGDPTSGSLKDPVLETNN